MAQKPSPNLSQELADKVDFLLECQALEGTLLLSLKKENQRKSVLQTDLPNWLMFFGSQTALIVKSMKGLKAEGHS